jgi:N,N'-diacetyllegionaminate synthase
MKQNKIIAEIGSVHDGSFGNAKKLIEESANAGADVVKFQLHIFEEESTSLAPNPAYFSDETRRDYFERTSFTKNQWAELKELSEAFGLEFLVSPFSIKAIESLEEIGVNEYKVPSGEVSNLPLLQKLSNIGKPVILSTGMSTWDEIDAAVAILSKNCDLTVLQCSSLYPCPNKHVGLNIIKEMKDRYGCDVGLSDHTLGFSASVAAAALGATVVEKHVTFSQAMYGSDASHSMNFKDFTLFCSMMRDTWSMSENMVDKDDDSLYMNIKQVFEKSIVASTDLKENTVISISTMSYKKPGTGISASKYRDLIGKKLSKSVKKDSLFSWDDFYE